MKKLLILLIFAMFSNTLFSQDDSQLDSAIVAQINASRMQNWRLNIGDSIGYCPTYNYNPTTLNFTGDSTYFYLDMSGDSLVWGGDMKLTESAKRFIDFCDQYTYTKIDSLEDVIKKLRK